MIYKTLFRWRLMNWVNVVIKTSAGGAHQLTRDRSLCGVGTMSEFSHGPRVHELKL
jgi:hypothetical protein